MSNTSWEPIIGLEIHVQLKTKTKMFCGCALSFGDDPNIHVCPVCLGHPGTLPTVNEQAVRYALMIGTAFECEIAPRSIFHRKNYFYPDLPKGYQISQYDIPICGPGKLAEVRIHRAHLEEDAAKLTHAGDSGRIHGSTTSVVDFNRGGTPLVEIVTEPDITSAAQAREWLQLLRETVRQIGVSDVNMDEGSLRCDANISLRPAGSDTLGVKTELKNMNSFRFIERGIDAEIERQREILDGGGAVEQATLHYDPSDGSITLLRSKEDAHDYRYFPEPDLVAIVPTEEMLATAREALPELPAARRNRYVAEHSLPEEPATTLAFTEGLGDYFEAALAAGDGVDPKALAIWVTGDLTAALREAGEETPAGSKVEPDAIAALVAMVEKKQVSRAGAKQVLAKLVAEGGDPAAIVESEGLGAMSDDGELEKIVAAAIEAEPEAADEVRGGNQKAIGRIMGVVMKETQGRADGGAVQKLIREQLGA
jgi:aspartyl-tRNA(Asn)/glutamyl-tRNA(Gln) amidotransferase subunit B